MSLLMRRRMLRKIESTKFVSLSTTYTKITRSEKLTNKYTVVMTEDVFDGEAPVFKLYYISNDVKTEIAVSGTRDVTETNGATYKLTFKAPNEVGEFPLELHYVLNDVESTDYIIGTIKIIK